ncbi:MAG: hypothetical protein ACO1NU_15015 [Arcticibacter sp.]
MKHLPFLTLAAALLSLSSCSEKIVGTWNIARYQRIVPGGKNEVTVTNIGTMKFKSNKTGEKEVKYSILNNKVESLTTFKWNLFDNYVTIHGADDEFNKTWIQVENSRKVQILKSTDGSDGVQVLELRK